MKRSRDGKVIHRDDCRRAGAAVHWNWADGMSDDEMFGRMLDVPWLRLCKSCFGTVVLDRAHQAVIQVIP